MMPVFLKPVTEIDIFRYRYHHGANLGSIYVLERWLTPSMFPPDMHGARTSELEAVKGWTERIGFESTREKFEEHWRGAVTDEELDWLRDVACCTSVRLPIGYFILPNLLPYGTPFEPYRCIYQNAWKSVQSIVTRLYNRGIGTLVDLHALPGGANGDDHSGTNSCTAAFWSDRKYQDMGCEAVEFIAREVKNGHLPGTIGIQLCNEAKVNSGGMYQWYDRAIQHIARVDLTIPIYISDGWNLDHALDYAMSKNRYGPNDGPTNPVIVDTHCYWCFSDTDKTKTPEQIIDDIKHKLASVKEKEGSVVDRGGAQVVVGEYSCVMSPESWSRIGDMDRGTMLKRFGQAQGNCYQSASGGAYFWTYKMDWMPGGEWGFRAQVDSLAIQPPSSTNWSYADVLTLLNRALAEQESRKMDAMTKHISYWTNTSPGIPFEHWRFVVGWQVGYMDAATFFCSQSDRMDTNPNHGHDKKLSAHRRKVAYHIGCLELWCLKRLRDSTMCGTFVWEFETGLRQGIRDFEIAVGLR